AAYHADEDVEHVHQLRVASRRADAALKLFRAYLPRGTYRKARARLRAIRRAAGDARDWDVFHADVREWQRRQGASSLPGSAFPAGFALGQRRPAQDRLVQVEKEHGADYPEFVAGVLDALRKPDEGGASTLLEHARSMLRGLLDQLEEEA